MHHKINSSIGKSFVGISYDFGGIWEPKGIRGISHLMEHLVFKTFDKHLSKANKLNINNNAFTSDNKVVFWLSGLNECVEQMSETFFNCITKQEDIWTEEAFDIEKKVVLQEYEDSFNDQSDGFHSNLLRKYYNYCGPIGFRKDIEEFSYEQSLEFAKKFYEPTALYEVGSHKLSPISFCEKKTPQTISFSEYDIELEEVPQENRSVVGLLSKVTYSKRMASKISLIDDCLNSGLESPLYQEIREKRGLSYGSRSYGQCIGDQVLISFFAMTKSNQAEELASVYNDFFSQPMEKIITKERFNDMNQSLIYLKKEAEILPHWGVNLKYLADYDRTENVDSFEYDEAIHLADSIMNAKNFQTFCM